MKFEKLSDEKFANLTIGKNQLALLTGGKGGSTSTTDDVCTDGGETDWPGGGCYTWSSDECGSDSCTYYS